MSLTPDYDAQELVTSWHIHKFVDAPFKVGYYIQAFSVLECFIVEYLKQIAEWTKITIPRNKHNHIIVSQLLTKLEKEGKIDPRLKKDIADFRKIRGDFVHNPEHEIYRHIIDTREKRKNRIGVPMQEAITDWENTIESIKRDLESGKECCRKLNKILFSVCPIKPEKYYEP